MEWPLFADVPPEDLRQFLAVASRRTFRRGEVVFHRNDLAESLHLIVKGHFAVRITTSLGESTLLDVLAPGDAFGELALLLPGSRRSATVAALEESETLSLLRDDFTHLQVLFPGVKDVLLRLLAQQLRRAGERIVEAHYTPAETRVRRRLCALAERFGSGGRRIVVPLTQASLAEMAGTSRATVNRVLREEEQRGTVELSRGKTIVLDLEGLQSRSRY